MSEDRGIRVRGYRISVAWSNVRGVIRIAALVAVVLAGSWVVGNMLPLSASHPFMPVFVLHIVYGAGSLVVGFGVVVVVVGVLMDVAGYLLDVEAVDDE